MGKKLTPMQILRDKLQHEIKIYNELCINTEVERLLLEGVINIINTEMLQIEREHIEDAVTWTSDRMRTKVLPKNIEQYFTQIYK